MSDYSLTSSFSEHMEHRHSAQNLSNSRDSEFGSHYQMESGLYITSYAAAIFVSAIIIVGVLIITLITALTVMLQSCQSSNAGVLQHQERSDPYDYCRIFALHAELNRLEINEFPSICKAHATQYIKGQYLKDLNWTILVVNNYFNTLEPHTDGLDVVILDVDDILTSNNSYDTSALQYGFDLYESNQDEKDKLQPDLHILELHSNLQTRGWSTIFITRRPEKLRNVTMDTLASSGYGSRSSLIMRSEDEMQLESWEYFSRRRVELQKLGFRITSVISSHMDALTGPCLGKRIFKLPSPLIHKVEHPFNRL